MPETPPRGGNRENSKKRSRRFAIVVVTEPTDLESLRLGLCEELGRATSIGWVSEPCPVGPAATYEVIELRMMVDGNWAVTGPA